MSPRVLPVLLAAALTGCSNLSVRADLAWDGGTLDHWCSGSPCEGPQAEIGVHYVHRMNSYVTAHGALVHRSYLYEHDRGEELVKVGAEISFGGGR